VPGQGQDEDGNPSGQDDAACRHEQHRQAPAAQQHGIGQRVQPVNGRQDTGQLTPLLAGHLP